MLGSGSIWLVGSRVASVGNHHHHFNPTCSGMLALKSGLRFAIRVLVVPFFGHLKMSLMQTCDLLRFTGTYQELQQEVLEVIQLGSMGSKRWQKMPRGGKR